MKNIVIIGAGFGGAAAALNLEKLLRGQSDISITLIDKEPYHLFHANMYEVATSEEDLTTIADLKRTIAIPVVEIIGKKKIKFVQARVDHIDYEQSLILAGDKKIPYDYLISACGSVNNFFGIPGAPEYGYPLKTLPDAFRIRNGLEFVVQQHSADTTKPYIRIIIGGGGFTGVELAGEMRGLVDLLSWKYEYPREKIDILVVEGANRLLPGLDDRVGQDVLDRLLSLGIRIQLNSMITNVEEKFITFKSGERLEFNCLIWTAGIKAQELSCSMNLALDKGSRVQTNKNLQAEGMPNVFFIGDQACVFDENNKPVPGTARQAVVQARYAARSVASQIMGQE